MSETYLTADEAIEKVEKYISNSDILDDGMVVNRLIIVTDDPDLNREILSKYSSGELNYRKVAELYGNGRNLRTYSVDSRF